MLGVNYTDNNISIYIMDCDNISKRFISGLGKYNLTIEDINNEWFYMGGETGQHLKNYKKSYRNKELPPHSDTCVCGHKIKNNCFITNGEDVLALGTACALRFVPKLDRICEECGEKHRNRKDNKCKKCRRKFRKIPTSCILTFD